MTTHETADGTLRELTPDEARVLLDRQARRYLGMSGEEFLRRYRAGEFADCDTPDVSRVADAAGAGELVPRGGAPLLRKPSITSSRRSTAYFRVLPKPSWTCEADTNWAPFTAWC